MKIYSLKYILNVLIWSKDSSANARYGYLLQGSLSIYFKWSDLLFILNFEFKDLALKT